MYREARNQIKTTSWRHRCRSKRLYCPRESQGRWCFEFNLSLSDTVEGTAKLSLKLNVASATGPWWSKVFEQVAFLYCCSKAVVRLRVAVQIRNNVLQRSCGTLPEARSARIWFKERGDCNIQARMHARTHASMCALVKYILTTRKGTGTFIAWRMSEA